MTTDKKPWSVGYTKKASRQLEELKRERPKVYSQAIALMKEMEISGPWRSNWPNYGLLKGNEFPKDTLHCHIKPGKPTYVACWCIRDKQIRIIEVFYVGTHEKAPY